MNSVVLTIFELLAFNAQKCRGQVTLITPPCKRNLSGTEYVNVATDCPWKRSGAEPQPKLNLVYFSHKIWFLVTIFNENDDRYGDRNDALCVLWQEIKF